MTDKILINSHNPVFVGLMSELVKGLRADDKSKINHVKSQFEKANISIGYDSKSDKIELLETGCRPVVLDAKKFESKETPKKKEEVK